MEVSEVLVVFTVHRYSNSLFYLKRCVLLRFAHYFQIFYFVEPGVRPSICMRNFRIAVVDRQLPHSGCDFVNFYSNQIVPII